MQLFNCHDVTPLHQGIDALHVDKSMHGACAAVSCSHVSRKNERLVCFSGDVCQCCDLMFDHGALVELPFIESRPVACMILILVIAEVSMIPDFAKLLVFLHGLGVKTENLGCGQLVSKGGKRRIC
jgi:hypothetical protein